MMNLLCKIYRKLVETHWSYRKKHSQVRIQTGGIFRVGKNVRIQKSTIYVDSTSELILDSHVQLIGVKIFVTKGSHVHISEYSCLKVREIILHVHCTQLAKGN